MKRKTMLPEGEDSRQDAIATVLISDNPDKQVAGVICIRHISPLVMAALQRANNPYVTGRAGFEAAGIDFDPAITSKGRQSGLKDAQVAKDRAAAFAMAMMPKTAEVLACLSCTREMLREFALNYASLESAALDILESTDLEGMAEATVFISQELQFLNKSRVVKAPGESKPQAASLAKKKQTHIG